MDADTIEKYFRRHRVVSYLLLGLSAFIILLVIFLSQQLTSQQAMTTASQASELVSYQGDGSQGDSNSIAASQQQGQTCPIRGTYRGISSGESQESDCFSIDYCTYNPNCGYKNVSYTCLKRQDSRGRQVRRNLGNSCHNNPIQEVAGLCGCAMAPTATPAVTSAPPPVVIPSPTAIPPVVEPSIQQGGGATAPSCSAQFIGSGGDAGYCMQSSGDTSVRYRTLNCVKNGVRTQKQVSCQSIGQGLSCCNLSTFTQPWADYVCGCSTNRP